MEAPANRRFVVDDQDITHNRPCLSTLPPILLTTKHDGCQAAKLTLCDRSRRHVDRTGRTAPDKFSAAREISRAPASPIAAA